MDDHNSSRQRQTEQPRPADDYFLGFIHKIAAAFSVELSEATQAIYLERLRRISSSQIQIAASRTIEEWNKASQMPPLAFILERCGPYQEMQSPVMPSFKRLAEQQGVTKEEIAQWLEAGKQAQREHNAILEADPQWQKMAAHLGAFPGLNHRAKDNVPSDPDERKAWATQKAKELGLTK